MSIGMVNNETLFGTIVKWVSSSYRTLPLVTSFRADITAVITHGEFLALYRGHTFRKKNKQERYTTTEEDYILLDVESSERYESIHLGTVTVEGFGLECWDYEEKFGKPRGNTIFANQSEMPSLPAKKLLRRLDELRRGGGKFGWNPTQDEVDVR